MVAAIFMIGGAYLFIKNIGHIVACMFGFYGLDALIGTWGALFLLALILNAL